MLDDPTERTFSTTPEINTTGCTAVLTPDGPVLVDSLERLGNDSETNQPPPPVNGRQRADGAPEWRTVERDLLELIKDLEARVTQLEKRVFPPAGFDERAYMRDYMKKYRRAKKVKRAPKSAASDGNSRKE